MKTLVALDGSDAAYNALKTTCNIAKRTHSYITAFYVNKGPEYTPDETGWISLKDRISNELENLGHEVINRAYRIGKDFGITMEGIIAYGIPASEILKHINAHGIIRLIAMGHCSKGRGAQEVVESTTKNIATQTKKPVLVSSAETDIRRILVAVDGSEHSRKAAQFGGNFAKSLGADLGIISFVPDAEAIINEYRLIAEVPNIEKHIEVSEKKLAEITERSIFTAKDILNSIGVSASSIIKTGSSDGIISEAKNYDLLIIGMPSNNSPGRIGNKIINTPSINAILVQ